MYVAKEPQNTANYGETYKKLHIQSAECRKLIIFATEKS